MKLINIMMTLAVLANLSFSPFISAKPNNYSGKKVDIKCHLELVGGGETIHFASVFKGNSQKYSQSLYNQKIWVAGKQGKHEVYKVNQCVEADKKFKLTRANTLEEDTLK
jgi:hypothetical protein